MRYYAEYLSDLMLVHGEWLCSPYCTTSTTQTNRKENGMLTRNKKLKDYGIPAEDIEK